MKRERPGHTLQATAVVHEAFVKLVEMNVSWQDRAHFFAVAARQMRRILVDHAKTRFREKRGGTTTGSLDELDALDLGPATAGEIDVLEIDEALTGWPTRIRGSPRWSSCIISAVSLTRSSSETLKVSEATVDREIRLGQGMDAAERSARYGAANPKRHEPRTAQGRVPNDAGNGCRSCSPAPSNCAVRRARSAFVANETAGDAELRDGAARAAGLRQRRERTGPLTHRARRRARHHDTRSTQGARRPRRRQLQARLGARPRRHRHGVSGRARRSSVFGAGRGQDRRQRHDAAASSACASAPSARSSPA